MRYELTDLRVFMAIATAQNLSQGAMSMHMTAPAVSYRLKNLEQALGASLFDRTARGMILTSAGEAVYRYAEAILNNVDKLHGEMARYTSHVVGHIRVFANSSTLTALPPPLTEFLAEYPNINVDLEDHLSEDTVRAVQEGQADIGLVASVGHLRGLECIPYNRDALVFVTPHHHPLTKLATVTVDIALQYDLVSVGRNSSNFLYLQKIASSLNRQTKVRVHMPNFAAALDCVRRGVGICLIPLSVAREPEMRNQVQVVHLDEPWAVRRQMIVARSLRSLPDYAQAFVRCLCAHAETDERP